MLTPVSYTHLDVYKRQVSNMSTMVKEIKTEIREKMATPIPWSNLSNSPKPPRNWPKVGARELPTDRPFAIPVSYTHLPGTDLEWFEYWRGFCRDWLLSLGMTEENMRLRDHEKEELSFYSKATTDIEYLFPFGWGELWGIADRTDYDLKQHPEHSGKSLEYFDQEANERYICLLYTSRCV